MINIFCQRAFLPKSKTTIHTSASVSKLVACIVMLHMLVTSYNNPYKLMHIILAKSSRAVSSYLCIQYFAQEHGPDLSP